jgi:hypothetical protein
MLNKLVIDERQISATTVVTEYAASVTRPNLMDSDFVLRLVRCLKEYSLDKIKPTTMPDAYPTAILALNSTPNLSLETVAITKLTTVAKAAIQR